MFATASLCSFQPSRVGADFSVEIFDWNQIEAAKSLGSAKIELADLEPFQSAERALQLVSTKHGQKGVVRVRLLFQPEIIAKSRKNTSTFSAARTMTSIGAMPLGAGKGVIQGVTGVFKKDKSKDDEALPPIPSPPAGQASYPVAPPDSVPDGPTSASAAANAPAENGNEPGILKVTVLDAKDLSATDIKPYVVLRVGASEYKTKHLGKTTTPEWCEFEVQRRLSD